jgi:hypothetical protein
MKVLSKRNPTAVHPVALVALRRKARSQREIKPSLTLKRNLVLLVNVKSLLFESTRL